ncbi:MAG TPA: excinuclease ABC subunit UvrC [Myxococcota bacterium]|nr:excinuclease ABC subunit UvrC [Myxococcota bacterium]
MDKGFQYVAEKIKHLAAVPGCYLMKDQEGEVFYVGKAKNLKARLKSYFHGQDSRIFVQYLEAILFDLEVLVVRNDIEALLLERELIKKHQPRFNIMLKDDKNYILLKLKRPKLAGRKRERFPRLEIVRKTKKDGARYFGPYPGAQNLRTTVELINKYFKLRTCPDQVIENRVRPCIQYQIGRCPAPCVYEVDDYGQEVENVDLFLSGQHQEIKERLEKKMWQLSQTEQYEAAALVRNQLKAIKTSLTSQVVREVNRERNQDIIGFARMGPEVMIVQILIRKGAWHHSHTYGFSQQPMPSNEALCSFVDQVYGGGRDIPHEILLPLPVADDLSALSALLKEQCGRAVRIYAPHRGKYKRLIEIANSNAELALNDRIKNNDAHDQALLALKDKLGLGMKPVRIECIDISLIQGKEPYGSLVAFKNGVPDKSGYRTYSIKSVSGMDDFAMIREVVGRRLKRCENEPLPDLMLIDGGKGQLNAALKAVEDANIVIDKDHFYLAGIAKARTLKEASVLTKTVSHSDERLFIPNEPEPLILKAHTFERYLVERIRDEAHRFALKAHQRGRKKRTLDSELLQAPGIGPKKALALLRHFGSIKKLKDANSDEIAYVAKISKEKAQALLVFLGS